MTNDARTLNQTDTESFVQLKKLGLSSVPQAFVSSLQDDDSTYKFKVSERLRNSSESAGDIIIGAFAKELVGIISITQDSRKKRKHKAELHGMFVLPES